MSCWQFSNVFLIYWLFPQVTNLLLLIYVINYGQKPLKSITIICLKRGFFWDAGIGEDFRGIFEFLR
jgi:hypothetical protein